MSFIAKYSDEKPKRFEQLLINKKLGRGNPRPNLSRQRGLIKI